MRFDQFYSPQTNLVQMCKRGDHHLIKCPHCGHDTLTAYGATLCGMKTAFVQTVEGVNGSDTMIEDDQIIPRVVIDFKCNSCDKESWLRIEDIGSGGETSFSWWQYEGEPNGA